MMQMKEKLDDVTTEIGEVKDRVSDIESGREDSVRSGDSEQGSSTDNTQSLENHIEHTSATPQSLRDDARLMRQAVEPLQGICLTEDDDDQGFEITRTKAQGKRSGSHMLAADSVKKTIDWPHFYIRRVTAGKRKSVPYAELRVEEFVYGFLTMLLNQKRPLDKEMMIEMLRTMKQDTMEFSWSNVRNFHDLVALDVEGGVLQWDNTDRIREMRMTYALTIFPDGKPAIEPAKQPTRNPPTNVKCCAPYQKRECEHPRDHPPFTHACAYCHRTHNTVCRHTEKDCFKKMAEESKNAKGGGGGGE